MTPTPPRTTQAAVAVAVAVAVVAAVLLAAVPARAQTSVGGAAAPTPQRDVQSGPVRKPAPGGANEGGRRSTTQPTTQRSATAAPALDVRRLVTALAVVIVLILLARWFVRRFFGVAGATRATRAVQVLSRSPLSPKQQLMLIRVGRRLLVVGDAGGQLNTLSEITDPDEVASLMGQVQDDHAGRATKSFGSLFGRMQGKFVEADRQDAEPDLQPESALAGPRRIADDGNGDGHGEERAVDSARQELSGLMDRVRMLSRQFKNP